MGPGIDLRAALSGSYNNIGNFSNLKNMDLSGLDLTNARLSKVDFTNTNLIAMNLEGAYWWYCIVQMENFQKKTLDKRVKIISDHGLCR